MGVNDSACAAPVIDGIMAAGEGVAYEGAWGGGGEQAGGVHELLEEGGAALEDVVVGAHACVDRVDRPQPHRRCRHPRADLRHEHQLCDLHAAATRRQVTMGQLPDVIQQKAWQFNRYGTVFQM